MNFQVIYSFHGLLTFFVSSQLCHKHIRSPTIVGKIESSLLHKYDRGCEAKTKWLKIMFFAFCHLSFL